MYLYGLGLPGFQHQNMGQASGPSGHDLPPNQSLVRPQKCYKSAKVACTLT